MISSRVVCIDIGSSFTKIAVRRGRNEQSLPVPNRPDDPESFEVLIPSLIVVGGGGKLIFGLEAARQRAAAGVMRVRNWKAALFAASRAGVGGVTVDAARQFLVQFLRFLRVGVLAAHDLSDAPVRLCIPALTDRLISDTDLCEAVREAGLQPSHVRPIEFEPVTNALGVLTRGRNSVWTPERTRGGTEPTPDLRMQDMFAGELALRYRQSGLAGSSGSYMVLIQDIGSFTVDFTTVRFETGFDGDDFRRPQFTQESFRHGVYDLDSLMLSRLRDPVQEAIRGMTLQGWETARKEICGGRAQRIRAANGQDIVELSLELQPAIQGAIADFGRTLVEARRTFLARAGFPTGMSAQGSVPLSIDHVITTGGGSGIERLRNVLDRPVGAGWHVEDLHSQRGVLLGSASEQLEAVRDRADGLRLARHGSAIGGTSVFFEFR